jgi:hypothetical protein
MTSLADPPSSRAGMPFAKSLGECFPSVLVALFAGTFAASLLLAVGMTLVADFRGGREDLLMAPGFAFVLMMPAFALAAPVSFFVGLPAYAWLRTRGWANVPTVLAVVAVAAAIVATTIDPKLAQVVALYGACIGLLTHRFQVRRDRSRPADP